MYSTERYLNSGLIKTYDYDSVIIGSSMVQNFILDEVKTLQGFVKPIKLSTHGGTIIEEMTTLNHAINIGKVKSVLFGLDIPFAFVTYDRDFPFYLYDENYLNDFFYLSNIDTLKRSIIYPIVSNLLPANNIKLDYNRMYEWQSSNKEGDFDEAKVRALFTQELDKPNDLPIIFPNNSTEYALELFNKEILTTIEHNKDIQFIFFIPPYSKLFYQLLEQNGVFKLFFELKQDIIKKLQKYPNVRFYDFHEADEITHNLNNYKDYTHFHQRYSTWILEQIKNNNFLQRGSSDSQ